MERIILEKENILPRGKAKSWLVTSERGAVVRELAIGDNPFCAETKKGETWQSDQIRGFVFRWQDIPLEQRPLVAGCLEHLGVSFAEFFLAILPYSALDSQTGEVGISLLIEKAAKVWGYNFIAREFQARWSQLSGLSPDDHLQVFIEGADGERLFNQGFYLRFL